jgi:cytochrome c5
MKILNISVALGVVAGGAAAQQNGVTSDTAFLPQGIAAAQLPDPDAPGARLVVRYCGQCHGIPSPATHSAADWEPTLRRMLMYMEREHNMGAMMGRGMGRGRRMGMNRAAVPTVDERGTLLAYLQVHGLKAIAADSVPASTDAGATAFTRTCGRCHALPDPTQHDPDEWPAVVARMRELMVQFKMDTVDAATGRQIAAYLQQAAGSAARDSSP